MPTVAAFAPVATPAQTGALRPMAAAESSADHDTWKWWYYVLAGVCIAGYSIWQAYNTQRLKPLGELFLAVILVAIGFWQKGKKTKS